MRKILNGLLLVWISLIPVFAHAHTGHGLIGEQHYHAPVEMELLLGLIVVGAIALVIKGLLGQKK